MEDLDTIFNFIIKMYNENNYLGIGVLIVAFMMKITKSDKTQIYEYFPKQYRSILPYICSFLVAIIGHTFGFDFGIEKITAENLSITIGDFLKLILSDTVKIGLVQHCLYEQLKGTKIGNLLKNLNI